LCTRLLAAVGEVAWVEAESLLDPATALSGGGPAYVFLFIECLAEAGVAAGLPPDLAMRLARSTVAGSGELARQDPQPVAALRQAVTSPGGTTLEALKILMAPDALQPLLTRALAAAASRSRELAGEAAD
jgi:pyrroline-5-carboxylate reductase